MKMKPLPRKKSVYQFITHMSLIVILITFNNCSQYGSFQNSALLYPEQGQGASQNPFPSHDETPGPNEPSAPVEGPLFLKGQGLTVNTAAGCISSLKNDFMDTRSWNGRRVEPQDCMIVRLATPLFVWPLPTDRLANSLMTFKLQQVGGTYTFSKSVLTPRILPESSLASGSYTWTVTYTNSRNVQITSAPRRFIIPSGSPLLSFPTPAAFTKSVLAKSHPRALPQGASFSGVASAALAGEYKVAYTNFLNKAQTTSTTAIPVPPPNLTRSNFGSDAEYNKWLLSLMHTAQGELAAIEQLAYAGLFTNQTTYDATGIQRLLSLAAWPTNGATSEATQDQANRAVYLALGLGLDLYQSKLSSSQRTTIVTAMKDRLSQTMAKFPGLDNNPTESHLLTAALFATEALMYAAGTPEFPESEALLAKAYETMITTFGPWGSNYDGGFGNGGAYGWFALTSVARMATSMRLMVNLDLTKWPAIAKFGDNQIAQFPANALLRGQFGDDVETTRHYYDYTWDAFRLYANLTGKSEYEWYWRADARNVSLATPLQPMHYLLLALKTPQKPTAVPVLPDSYVFEDAGVVALHSKTTQSNRSSVFFRSSRFGTYNHSHGDNNAFTFVSQGKEILISGGYYPYYNSPHHAFVGRATRFKNALTFDGGIGQAETITQPMVPGSPVHSQDTRGQLLNFADNGTWALTTGDATLAYRGLDKQLNAWVPLLSNAIRSIAYNRKEGVVLIYDWATSDKARQWELNFQFIQRPAISGSTIQAANGTASACIEVFGNPGTLNMEQGFPVAAEKTVPDQYRVRSTANQVSHQLVAVTVIRESCRSVPIQVNFNHTTAEVRMNTSDTVRFKERTIELD